METEKVSDKFKLLNEITNVGAKHAAVVLTKMIGISVDVSFPEMSVVNLDELLQSDEFKDKLVGFGFSRFRGDIQGIAALLLPDASVRTALKSFFYRDIKSLDEMEDMDYSGLKEIGNIIIASFLNALSNTYQITALPTVPDVAVDLLPSIFQEFSLMLMSEDKENLISFRTQLVTQGGEKVIFGSLLIFFDPESSIPIQAK